MTKGIHFGFVFSAVPIFVAASLFVSCNKTEQSDDPAPPSKNTFLDLSEASLSFSGEGMSDTVLISTDCERVTAESGASWCRTTVSKGLDTLFVTVIENTEGEDRSTIISVKGSGLDEDRIISVSQKAAEIVYCIDAGSLDFSDTRILQLLSYDGPIAYACWEYVFTEDKTVDSLMTVVYPVNGSGLPDIREGVGLYTGGKVSWTKADTTDVCKYTPGTGTPGRLYYCNGKISSSASGGTLLEAPAVEYSLVDVRDMEAEVYPLVKIGTRLWLGKNLKTKYYRDGTEISSSWFKEEGSWKKYYFDDEEIEEFWAFGNVYNGYAVKSDRGLAPQGWEIPSIAEWKRLKNYLRSNRATKLKSPYWITDEEEQSPEYVNITGFSITGGYLVRPTGEWYDEIERTTFWATDEFSNDKGKKSLGYMYLAISSIKNFSLKEEYVANGMDYGYYVRCYLPLL